MTAQAKEIIIYDGNEYRMASEPLAQYFKKLKKRPVMEATLSCCWRGYIGTWEVRVKKLFLIDFTAHVGDDNKRVDYIFPGKKEVFADWFNGVVKIPQGMLMKYVHSGYESIYERDIILEFKKGVLISSITIDNSDFD